MALLVPRGQWARNTNSKPNWLPWKSGGHHVLPDAGRLVAARQVHPGPAVVLAQRDYSRIVLAVDTDKEGEEAFALVEQCALAQSATRTAST